MRTWLFRDIFLAPVLCGTMIQCLKVALYSIVEHRLRIGRITQADGMPNLHSAVVASLGTAIGVKYGFSSILFSLVAVYGVIIIHDTMRLKGEKQKQGDLINRILFSIEEHDGVGAGTAMRVLRFKPFDVASGTILGVLFTCLILKV
ncbi:MAG: divergent PAP2 family protein [Candidatus Krumholzibacteriota bacterium]|nr:divergent PAP2 family protein [Candidatus Krumholzibacteriota bacterium]